ncbi:ABC transporter substrate-binding protein [Marinomonas sp. M1K-6]|uniref:ABC transporter substrate-binding protein n=1 Tax=Marinomonas profundi TaxID=2726122 RepID=A0A847R9K9_9GAMM|nr:ABC transporter substrate-binding protein [Marinomonas profundi]NLQ17867.1 ABC transporter substrate-binding protein [Marinomonas profundi]UDV03476.1 ABC transporter substrate-binding protein [Marinomonas profundi]
MMNLRKILAIGSLAAFSQLATAATPSPTAALFDLGSLDTMVALGLGDNVVAVPKQTLPDYLTQFNDARYTDVGGLKNPDLKTLTTLRPDLIVITGRQAGSKAELETISKVKQVNASGEDYWTSFSANVTSLAAEFKAQAAAERALAELNTNIASTKAAIKGAPTALFVTHNNGAFSLRNEPIATQLLGLASSTLPDHVKSQQRGTRSFTSLKASDIAQMKPTTLFIIDRSAAIGNTKEALDVEKLKADLAAQGGQSIKVAYLSPRLWYLSGNGLQSLNLQIKEIANAL